MGDGGDPVTGRPLSRMAHAQSGDGSLQSSRYAIHNRAEAERRAGYYLTKSCMCRDATDACLPCIVRVMDADREALKVYRQALDRLPAPPAYMDDTPHARVDYMLSREESLRGVVEELQRTLDDLCKNPQTKEPPR